MGRGMLKQEILANLIQAGDEGMSVRELAIKLGIRSQNIHVWFSSTGKKVPDLFKIGEGRYCYKPSKPGALAAAAHTQRAATDTASKPWETTPSPAVS